jgi:hypothetical protein
MKTYTKILLPTLPLICCFLAATIAITYHFSRTALLDLGDAWLSTRLNMAMEVAREQEKVLHDYGLESIPASIAKAKQAATDRIRNITIGNQGYVFIVDRSGAIIFHPNKYLNDTDLGREKWFASLTDQGGRRTIDLSGERLLVRFGYFPPWEWYVLAADPTEELYGAINRMVSCHRRDDLFGSDVLYRAPDPAAQGASSRDPSLWQRQSGDPDQYSVRR